MGMFITSNRLKPPAAKHRLRAQGTERRKEFQGVLDNFGEWA
jgi:hypothetical protein